MTSHPPAAPDCAALLVAPGAGRLRVVQHAGAAALPAGPAASRVDVTGYFAPGATVTRRLHRHQRDW